jgi:(p)ppGpp synthase/HD superfamily hydrolase
MSQTPEVQTLEVLYPPDKETDTPVLSDRFDRALLYAATLHRKQVRKGSQVPYLTHLMAVAGLVLEHDGDEELAIAGLLHDSVEDQGGEPIAREIRELFGDRVADVVLGCSDSSGPKGELKRPWKIRKEEYLAHFRDAHADVRTVSMADKLHNCRTTVSDLHEQGLSTFDKFNATREDTLWFYREFTKLARELQDGRLARELERIVFELHKLAS